MRSCENPPRALPRSDSGRGLLRYVPARENGYGCKERRERPQGKSFIASSASTPPVIEMGTKGVFDAI